MFSLQEAKLLEKKIDREIECSMSVIEYYRQNESDDTRILKDVLLQQMLDVNTLSLIREKLHVYIATFEPARPTATSQSS